MNETKQKATKDNNMSEDLYNRINLLKNMDLIEHSCDIMIDQCVILIVV